MNKLYREVKASSGKYVLRPVDPDNIESVLIFVEPIEITEWLENKIQGCDELVGMAKEKWAFQQCLKQINK